jgi:hypothetical protein
MPHHPTPYASVHPSSSHPLPPSYAKPPLPPPTSTAATSRTSSEDGITTTPPNDDVATVVAESYLPSPPSSPERKVSTQKTEEENEEHLDIEEEQLVVIGTEKNIDEELGMMSSKPIDHVPTKEEAAPRTEKSKETISSSAGTVSSTEKLETIANVAHAVPARKTPSATAVGDPTSRKAGTAISDMSPIAMCFDRMLVAGKSQVMILLLRIHLAYEKLCTHQ